MLPDLEDCIKHMEDSSVQIVLEGMLRRPQQGKGVEARTHTVCARGLLAACFWLAASPEG